MRNFMLKKPVSRIALPIAAIVMLLFAISSVSGGEKVEVNKPVIPPAASDFRETVAGVGIVEPKSEIISIGTNLPGIVTSVSVKVDDEVKKGQVMFSIDHREAVAELAKAEAQLASAEVQAADLRQQLSMYENIADKRAISGDELQRKKYASKLADAKLKEAKAAVDAIKTTLDRLKITAPIDGTILRVNIRPGEYAQAGASTSKPLIVMGDVSEMRVRVEIDETDASRLNPKAKAYGSLRGTGDKQVELKFVRTEPLLSPKRSLTGDGNERVDTRVQELIYSFDNKKAGSYVGQQMDVFIDAAAD